VELPSGSLINYDGPSEFMSESFVLDSGQWCHSNRLDTSSRLTPILSMWGEGKWGENKKNPKNFVKKFTFFQLVAQFVGEWLTVDRGHAGCFVALY